MAEFIKVTKKKPEVLEAVQWFKNGDHPHDECWMVYPEKDSSTQVDPGVNPVVHFEPFLSEGKVVRYFRHPDVSGETKCSSCGQLMHFHGWIDKTDTTVCPGSWIVSINGEYKAIRPHVFENNYQVL